MSETVQRRYDTVSMILHWLIAAILIFQLFLGGWVSEQEGPGAAGWMTLHKSIGVTILLLTLLRLVWRLAHPAPPLPRSIPRWQRLLARANHTLFYVALIVMPLFGYVMSSGGDGAAGEFFGLFPLPAIPGVSRDAAGLAHDLHGVTSDIIWVLIGLHVLGALKHLFIDRMNILRRMAPVPGAAPAADPEA